MGFRMRTSNLNAAIKISLDAARKYTREFKKQGLKEPYSRTYFQPSGVHVRYFIPAPQVSKIASDITKEIFERVQKTKGVEIAYPHTEILYRKK